MDTIPTKADLIRQLGIVFLRLNDQIGNQIEPQIQSDMGKLEGDWQDVSRQRYEQLYRQWHAAIKQFVQVGEDLGRHLQNTAQAFEQVDQSY